MTATSKANLCKICGLWSIRASCGKCGRQVCNIHFCDVCRNCSKDCICWLRPGSVYHPPPNEPPPR